MSYRRVICRVCDKARFADGHWADYEVPLPDDVTDGLCPMCKVTLEASRELGRKLQDRRARRERREGRKYGPGAGDPFRGVE